MIDNDWEADNETDIEVENGIEALKTTEHRDVCVAPKARVSIRPP